MKVRWNEQWNNDLNENVNTFGENTTRDRLIAMHNVSRLADESKNFESFLTVVRKYRYSCVYIFHMLFPEKNFLEINFISNKYNILYLAFI